MFKLVFTALFLFQFMDILTAAPAPTVSQPDWKKQALTYYVSKTPINISKKDTQTAFRNAFDQVKKLLTPSKTYTEVQENDSTADFRITFITLHDRRMSFALPNGNITFTAEDNWKYHKVGDKVDPKKNDLTYAAMSAIKYVLAINDEISSKIFVNKNYADSNGNYVLPTFYEK